MLCYHRYVVVLLLALPLTLLSLVANAAKTNAPPSNAIWNTLLQQHVVVLDDGRASQVDYQGMRADEKQLKRYLATLSAVTQTRFDTWSNPDQKAFLINAYNAWTVDLILTGKPSLASIKDLGHFWQSPWQKAFIPLLGNTRTLDSIEDQLRQHYHDPRIHFAINCASIGCPALSNQAYAGSRLNTQLHNAAVHFLSDRSRNYVQHGALSVSSIFKWYHDDFAAGWQGINSLRQFLAHYSQALGLNSTQTARLINGKMTITYLDYDWRLNRVTTDKGSSHRTTAATP